ncbi:TIGR04282 family arsenosugar biosynthesis glycosyltransferase [Cellulophaga omnivescoria]|uniref:TIGR04282 family arsenosugar biosynthesis glycosyltransferase n=1 Tax=Cellulophaga omnivescoria TaxID=1888890 RepID=UPI0015598A70|nr:TIGR04282 family arsenosugar biosynthesis glycosyltransferase [Cellulophaga omnivescoria]WBU90180.1 TIGR04282 family arsenosugar biosynthesis glycosyltransferase [Cellulophaga omnivescoria]WKB82304.1 TIGR04282 family arsenosugar biosynthesis glycosyltransferase [Cellulophaga lytica]
MPRKFINYILKKLNKNLLLIFTRNPELGKCKTRLAAKTGDKIALDIYKFLLNHTVSITTKLNADKQVHYSVAIRENDIWDSTIYQKKLQDGSNLGTRMMNAFKQGFADGYKNIIIIGSDLYDLNTADIQDAFNHLLNNDFVVGPATDGGYYLLGMKKLNHAVFENKDWGTNTVLKDTLNNLKDEKIKLLEAKNDVDYYEDIKDIDAFKPFLKNIKND